MRESIALSDIRHEWEARARASGDRLSGVLFRGLSDQANAAVHEWHAWVAHHVFLPGIPPGGRILDLGCGYGRLALVATTARPDLDIIGQDITLSYCRNFQRRFGKCIRADLSALPFAPASFDGVMAITCLMYAEPEQVAETLERLRGVIKPGGALLLLDPGVEVQRLVAAVRRGASVSATGGNGFEQGQYLSLIERAGFEPGACGGNPRLSAALMLPGMARSSGQLAGRALRWCASHDQRASGYARLALHRWVLAVRPGNSSCCLPRQP